MSLPITLPLPTVPPSTSTNNLTIYTPSIHNLATKTLLKHILYVRGQVPVLLNDDLFLKQNKTDANLSSSSPSALSSSSSIDNQGTQNDAKTNQEKKESVDPRSMRELFLL